MMIAVVVLMPLPVVCDAQQDAAEAAMMFLGAESVEVLDQYEIERFDDLLRNPLKINVVSPSVLEQSGVMSRYQVASLTDYLKRHGDVMSLSELASVDGFGREYVSRIAPFVSLETYRDRPVRMRDMSDVRHEVSARMGARSGKDATYGLKYRLDASDILQGRLAFSRTSASRSYGPDAFSGSLMWNFRKVNGSLIVGDYNARFGQGLALWNGMSLGGVPAPSSLMKRSSGISSSSSYTGNYSMRGAAGCVTVRKVRMSALVALSSSDDVIGLLPGFNASVYFRNGIFSMTHYADLNMSPSSSGISDMKTSADYSACFNGKDFFTEVAYDWISSSAALLAGCVLPAGDDVRLGLMARVYPSDYSPSRSAALRSSTRCSNEYSLSLCSEFFSGRWISLTGREGFASSARRHSGVVSIDAALFPESKDGGEHPSCQLKSRADWTMNLSGSWNLKLRFSERIRSWDNPFRTEFRSDLAFDDGSWTVVCRLDLVKCAGWSYLSYAEAGHKGKEHALYLRAGIFRADDWDDRIYAYERDAPGSFNVPAYYGRGVWAAFTFRWRFARWGKVYFRAAATSYAFMEEEKPGKAELKLQFEFDL